MVLRVMAPAGIVALVGAHPAALGGVVADCVGVGVSLGVTEGAGLSVGAEIGEVAVGLGVAEGIRKHPLSISAAPLMTAANRERDASRFDMTQS
jgi:hypothetical protein